MLFISTLIFQVKGAQQMLISRQQGQCAPQTFLLGIITEHIQVLTVCIASAHSESHKHLAQIPGWPQPDVQPNQIIRLSKSCLCPTLVTNYLLQGWRHQCHRGVCLLTWTVHKSMSPQMLECQPTCMSFDIAQASCLTRDPRWLRVIMVMKSSLYSGLHY